MILIQHTIQFSDIGLNQIIYFNGESSSFVSSPSSSIHCNEWSHLNKKASCHINKGDSFPIISEDYTAKSNSLWVCMSFILPSWTTLNWNSKCCDSHGYYWTLNIKWKTQDKSRESHFESYRWILLSYILSIKKKKKKTHFFTRKVLHAVFRMIKNLKCLTLDIF